MFLLTQTIFSNCKIQKPIDSEKQNLIFRKAEKFGHWPLAHTTQHPQSIIAYHPPSRTVSDAIHRASIMVEDSVLTVVRHWSITLGDDLSAFAREVDSWDVKMPIKLHVDVLRASSRNSGRKDLLWSDFVDILRMIPLLRNLTINAFFHTNSGKRALPLSLMAKILRDTPTLESLQLDQVGLYCDGEPQHIFQSLSDAFQSHGSLRVVHIHRLCFPSRFSRNHASVISDGALRQLCSQLVTAQMRCSTLQSFTLEAPSSDILFRLDLNEEAQRSIFKHSSLLSVRLRNVVFLPTDTHRELMQYDFDNNISYLSLTNCIFGEDLSQFVARRSILQELDLSGSTLKYNMSGLCCILKKNHRMRRLTLSHAQLDHTEAVQHESLIRTIHSCRGHPELEYLDIRGFYDYHYNDEDLSRPIELFLATVEAVVGLVKANRRLTTVLLDDIEHPSLAEPLSALSLYLKLNNCGGATTSLSSSSIPDIPSLLFNRHELAYLYHVVKRNPTSLRIDTNNS